MVSVHILPISLLILIVSAVHFALPFFDVLLHQIVLNALNALLVHIVPSILNAPKALLVHIVPIAPRALLVYLVLNPPPAPIASTAPRTVNIAA